MSEAEEAIWNAFRADPPDWLGIEPDFSGYGETLVTWDSRTGSDESDTRLIRMDGIVETDPAVCVCDVRETLDHESLGRVLSHTSIYRRRKHPEKPVVACIVFAKYGDKSAGVLEATDALQEDVNLHLVEDIPEKLSRV